MTQEFVTLPREVVERALEAMSLALSDVDWRKDSPTQPVIHKAYNATRSALEQPRGEQEPVGFVRQIDIEQIAKTPSDWGAMFGKVMGFNTVPVYTHPQPQAEQEQEPVAWIHQCNKRPDLFELSFSKREPMLAAKGYKARPLVFGDIAYSQSKRKPLTDDEIDKLCQQFDDPMFREM